MENLKEAKFLCQKEKINDTGREKYDDELELQSIDLDYETIHSEILKNIVLNENDSGLSDFDEKRYEDNQKKVFEINKIKNIIHKSIKSLFAESQNNELFTHFYFPIKISKIEMLLQASNCPLSIERTPLLIISVTYAAELNDKDITADVKIDKCMPIIFDNPKYTKLICNNSGVPRIIDTYTFAM